MARMCCDTRKSVRQAAITYLQRALLAHELQSLTSSEWEACFLQVNFDLSVVTFRVIDSQMLVCICKQAVSFNCSYMCNLTDSECCRFSFQCCLVFWRWFLLWTSLIWKKRESEPPTSSARSLHELYINCAFTPFV